MSELTLLGRARLTGIIELVSGLHIGAGKDTIEIGGVDNPVVKHPHTLAPYIPGSSLKGRLRFLLEWAFLPVYGCIDAKKGRPWGFDPSRSYDARDPVLRIFGTTAPREKWQGGPTRLMVRDAFLDEAWREETRRSGWDLIETKTETAIDRIEGKALTGSLRTSERVPAGARFGLEMVFRLYEVDGDKGEWDRHCLNWLLAGLSLVEQDALGGAGSRGYGRVRFAELCLTDIDGSEQALGERFRVNRFDPSEPPRIV